MQAISDYGEYWTRLRGTHQYHPANRFRYWLLLRELECLRARFSSIIDCGCGDGSLLRLLRSRLSPESACGIDVSAETITALKTMDPSGDWRRADLGVELDPGSWPKCDLVVCSEVIEHVPDDAVLLRNLSLFTKPGGWLALSTQGGAIRRTERFLGHLRHYDLEGLKRSVESSGFRVVKSLRCGWPLLNLQKRLAEIFFSQVQSNIVGRERPSPVVSAVFSAFYQGYKVCSYRRGPQLLILARREESS